MFNNKVTDDIKDNIFNWMPINRANNIGNYLGLPSSDVSMTSFRMYVSELSELKK